MAIVTKNPSSLKLRYDCGYDEETGKTIIKNKTYGNVLPDASSDNLFDVANIIASLQNYDILEIARLDNSTLSY